MRCLKLVVTVLVKYFDMYVLHVPMHSKLTSLMNYTNTDGVDESSCCVKTNILDCNIVVSEFELNLYYVNLEVEKGRDPFIAWALTEILLILFFLQGWLWYLIICESWYAIKQTNQTKNLHPHICSQECSTNCLIQNLNFGCQLHLLWPWLLH